MSLLPGIAMSMTTVALWTRDMRRTRLLYLTNSPNRFTYDIHARSYSCMVIEAIAFVSYAVAVWRFDIKKQPQACKICINALPSGRAFSCFKGCVGVAYHVSASSKSTRSGRTGSSPMTVCM